MSNGLVVPMPGSKSSPWTADCRFGDCRIEYDRHSGWAVGASSGIRAHREGRCAQNLSLSEPARPSHQALPIAWTMTSFFQLAGNAEASPEGWESLKVDQLSVPGSFPPHIVNGILRLHCREMCCQK